MSILNCVVASDRILVASDSNVAVRGGPFNARSAEVPKILALPHMAAIIGCTGDFTMACVAWSMATEFPFDELLERGAAELTNRYRKLRSVVPGADKQGVLIAGYSPSRGRLIAGWFEQQNRREGFIGREIDTLLSTDPGAELLPVNADILATTAGMTRVMAAQLAQARLQQLGASYGGRIVFAELLGADLSIRMSRGVDLDAEAAAAA